MIAPVVSPLMFNIFTYTVKIVFFVAASNLCRFTNNSAFTASIFGRNYLKQTINSTA